MATTNTSQTIAPSIAGYAASDPYFALGLMLGRGIANNWEQRGTDKLEATIPKPFDPANPSTGTATTGYQINQSGGDPTAQTAPIWAANSGMQAPTVNPYQIDINGGSQPLTNAQRNLMQEYINQANTQQPQASMPTIQGFNVGAQNIPQLRSWLSGETPQQAAVLDAVQNQQAQNQQLQNQQNQQVNPSQAGQASNNAATVQPNDVVPLPTQGRRENARDKGDMYNRPFVHNNDGTTSTMLSTIFNDDDGYHIISSVWDGKTHTPQEAIQRYYTVGDNGMATYDSLENAQAADQAMHKREENRLQYENDPQALQRYTDSLRRADHPDWYDRNGSYVGPQQAQPPAQQAAIWSAQSAPAQQPVQLQPQQAAQPPKPFSMAEWEARVWEEGRKQGRPTSQIQAVIERTRPMAQAAEERSKRETINYYTNRIFNGDETTGGQPLITNIRNYPQAIPQLYSAMNQIAQVDPNYAKSISNLLPMPTAMDVWKQDADVAKENREEQRNYRMGDHNAQRNQNQAIITHNMQRQWLDQQIKEQAANLARVNGGTPEEWEARLRASGYGYTNNNTTGRGTASGRSTSGSSNTTAKMTASEQQAYNGYSDTLNDLVASMSGSDGYRSAAIQKAKNFMRSDDWDKVPMEQRHIVEQGIALSTGIMLAKSGNYKEASAALAQLTEDGYRNYGITDPNRFIRQLGLNPSWVNYGKE